jgi:hypothetical protein
MAKTVAMVGLEPGELAWVRTVVSLLRHPDPLVAEVVQQALRYLERSVREQAQTRSEARSEGMVDQVS